MVDSKPLRFGEADPAIDARVDELLARMTLAEKIGQMNQSDVNVLSNPAESIRSGAIGSLLSIVDP
ncbi:MAG: hypothetical protein JOZ51_14890, partial [Chloroflexi bacterium]|nr:hypothetical protein [Chloroflexota bacterium]